MHCAWFEDLMHRERKYLTKLVSCLQDIPSDSNTLSCFCYACTRLSMPVCLSVTRRYWVKTDNHRIALGRSRYCQFFETRFNTRRHRETPLATASYPTSQGNTPCNGFIPEVTGKHPLQWLHTWGHRETPLATASYPRSQGNTPCNGFIPDVTGNHPLQRLHTWRHRETPLATASNETAVGFIHDVTGKHFLQRLQTRLRWVTAKKQICNQ